MERAGFYRTLHGTPPPSDKPRCVVCGDESSGIHYGVNSCEGCKGFFRRCMVKGMQQKCTNNEECEITRFARNSCQFCRLKKCVRVGMSRSASKVGRRPKTTSVLASDVTNAAATAKKLDHTSAVSRPVGGPRRSQSLVASSSSRVPPAGPDDSTVRTSPAGTRRSSVYERVRDSVDLSGSDAGGLQRTGSPFVTPYPTPSSSRAPSTNGVDGGNSSWLETDESNDHLSSQVIDYSLNGNYQGYTFQQTLQRSPVYHANNITQNNPHNNNNGRFSDAQPSSMSGALDGDGRQPTGSERGWMSSSHSMNLAHHSLHDQDSNQSMGSFQHNGNGKISTQPPQRTMLLDQLSQEGNGHYRNADNLMQHQTAALDWSANNLVYQQSLSAANYYKDFYSGGPH